MRIIITIIKTTTNHNSIIHNSITIIIVVVVVIIISITILRVKLYNFSNASKPKILIASSLWLCELC